MKDGGMRTAGGCSCERHDGLERAMFSEVCDCRLSCVYIKSNSV